MDSEFLIPSFTKEGERIRIKLKITDNLNSYSTLLKQVKFLQQSKGIKVSPLAIKQLKNLESIALEYDIPMIYICEFIFPKIEK